MRFRENTKELKNFLFGELEMHPIANGTILLEPRISCKNSITSHTFFSAELLEDNTVISISLNANNLELNKFVENGIIQTYKIFLKSIRYQNNDDLTIKSITSKGEIILLIRFSYELGYYDYKIVIFDSNCNKIDEKNIENIDNIISIAENDSKYYCLLTSTSNSNFLSIYDYNLNHIESKGLNTIESTDPFYFSSNAKQLRVMKQSIFILETVL
jgi:hypothetical protein